MFCALGLLGGLVLGFVRGLVLGSVRGKSSGQAGPKAGAGGGFPFALANMLEVFLGGLGEGKEEAAGHLVERGVAWVFPPDNPRFPPVDTGDGAHLHACGVRDVDFGANEGVVGTIPPPKGGCLGGGGGLCGRGGLGAMRQRKLGSHTPPCHRRMVITTIVRCRACCTAA